MLQQDVIFWGGLKWQFWTYNVIKKYKSNYKWACKANISEMDSVWSMLPIRAIFSPFFPAYLFASLVNSCFFLLMYYAVILEFVLFLKEFFIYINI